MLLAAVLFTLPSVMHEPHKDMVKWNSTYERFQRQEQVNDKYTQKWHNDIDAFKGRTQAQKLNEVNLYWNTRINYITDPESCGKVDCYNTPSEVTKSGAGDCEEYSMSKYYSLRRLGFAANRMRVTAVTYKDEIHSVLVVDGQVLDNRTDSIKDIEYVNYYQPHFSINENHLWTLSEQEVQKLNEGR